MNVHQFKNIVNIYNKFNPNGAHITMSYKLEPDLIEMELPDEYPAGPDSGSDDPDDPPSTKPPGH